jgi:hypothetical protein
MIGNVISGNGFHLDGVIPALSFVVDLINKKLKISVEYKGS